MIELLFVVCLSAQPDVCSERSLVFAEQISPAACSMQAQPYLADWVGQHPRWQVTRWKCQPVDRRSARS